MSYILEALKKAQAERQLGATPDVHAPTIDAYAARQSARPAWLPAALGGALAIGALGLALWWRQDAPAVTPPQAGARADADAAGAVAQAQAQATATATATATAEPVTLPAAAAQPDGGLAVAAPAPVAAQPISAARSSGAPAPAAQPAAAAARSTTAPSVATVQAESRAAAANGASPRPAAGAPAVPSPPQQALAAAPAKPAAPPEPQDDIIPAARDLPEPIQRILPTVAMSGYMYSKNPADRLVLIDKALRREGDEVAPGLILERLQPKGAVFTFRGYRYRVPY